MIFCVQQLGVEGCKLPDSTEFLFRQNGKWPRFEVCMDRPVSEGDHLGLLEDQRTARFDSSSALKLTRFWRV